MELEKTMETGFSNLVYNIGKIFPDSGRDPILSSELFTNRKIPLMIPGFIQLRKGFRGGL